jgi:hypothetical protein
MKLIYKDYKDYKNKYLKYKQKYLNLVKELKGGAKCPNVGFHQHIGECWHDSFLMIILYSDNFSEHIQKIFDTTDTHKFDYKDCITYAMSSSPKIFRPLQIDDSDFENFIVYGGQYIANIFERYNNEKLEFASASISKDDPQNTLFRADSVNQSLICNYNSFKLSNLNILPEFKRTYTHYEHGGIFYHDLNNISLINYFLTNYFPSTLKFENKQKKYLYFKHFDLVYIFNFPNLMFSEYPLVRIDHMINQLNILKSFLVSDKLIGINLGIHPLLENVDQIKKHLEENTPPPKFPGHSVALITCNGENYFYDNNGVIDNEKDLRQEEQQEVRPEVPPEMQEEIQEEDQNKTEEIQLYPFMHAERNGDRIMKYDWKNFFIETIDENIEKLNEMKSSTDSLEKKVSDINDIFLSFSNLFTRKSDSVDSAKLKCGKKYLEHLDISTIDLVLLNEFNDSDDIDNIEQEYININLNNIIYQYTSYTNNNIFEILLKIIINKNISEEESYNLYETIFIELVNKRNFEIINKFLSEDKINQLLKLKSIIMILSDILSTPYNDTAFELLKVLTSHPNIKTLDFAIKKFTEVARSYNNLEYVNFLEKL